jgi:hypothetical protein
VKITTLILLFGSLFLFTACPGGGYQSDLERMQENGMDFPDLRSQRYGQVKFQLSSLFSRDYGADYHTMQDNALGFIIYDMDIHFTVERFDSDEVEMIQFAFDDDISAIDAVHDNYILKRQASLYDGETGIKKELPNSVKYPGYIQVIEGASSSYMDDLSYFTATLDIDGELHVFQMIGKGENMGYIYDDFIDLLSSVSA